MENIPWVEKYRPINIESIVLDDSNKLLIKNMIDQNYFPNLLFHGPPGTGKTTTIISLIRSFLQKNYGHFNTGCFIHLNASDERGIEVVRNQITTFINAENLFFNGLKFVILDEADYMTKAAQVQLKEVIQKFSNTRFCLICNYITKIDFALRNEFVRISFNRVPHEYITNFLKGIVKSENLKISTKNLSAIQKTFDPDIRSMINYLQLNFRNTPNKLNIVNNSDFEYIFAILKQKGLEFEQFEKISEKIMAKYDLGIDGFIKKLIFFIFEKCPVLYGNSSYLDLLENIQKNINEDQILQYYWFNLIEYF